MNGGDAVGSHGLVTLSRSIVLKEKSVTSRGFHSLEKNLWIFRPVMVFFCGFSDFVDFCGFFKVLTWIFHSGKTATLPHTYSSTAAY